MRDDSMEWLLEAERYEDRAKEILDLARKARPDLDDIPVEKRDLPELLDVRVIVTSAVPGVLRNAGCGFEGWFTNQ